VPDRRRGPAQAIKQFVGCARGEASAPVAPLRSTPSPPPRAPRSQPAVPVGSHNWSAPALRPRSRGLVPLDRIQLRCDPPVMFWHMVLFLLSSLASFIGRLIADDRDRETLALRQQVLVLQRRLGTRPRLLLGGKLALRRLTVHGQFNRYRRRLPPSAPTVSDSASSAPRSR
jgi:hypothetical protein